MCPQSFNETHSEPDNIIVSDNDQRIFQAWGSGEVKDLDGEILPISEFKKFMPIYMSRGAPLMLRHSSKAVGKILNYEFKEVKPGVEGVFITGQLFKDYDLDNATWNEVKSGKLGSISFGGTAQKKSAKMDKNTGEKADVLSGIDGFEFSLVEQPANPLANMTFVNTLAKSVETKKGYYDDQILDSEFEGKTFEELTPEEKKRFKQMVSDAESMHAKTKKMEGVAKAEGPCDLCGRYDRNLKRVTDFQGKVSFACPECMYGSEVEMSAKCSEKKPKDKEAEKSVESERREHRMSSPDKVPEDKKPDEGETKKDSSDKEEIIRRIMETRGKTRKEAEDIYVQYAWQLSDKTEGENKSKPVLTQEEVDNMNELISQGMSEKEALDRVLSVRAIRNVSGMSLFGAWNGKNNNKTGENKMNTNIQKEFKCEVCHGVFQYEPLIQDDYKLCAQCNRAWINDKKEIKGVKTMVEEKQDKKEEVKPQEDEETKKSVTDLKKELEDLKLMLKGFMDSTKKVEPIVEKEHLDIAKELSEINKKLEARITISTPRPNMVGGEERKLPLAVGIALNKAGYPKNWKELAELKRKEEVSMIEKRMSMMPEEIRE